MSEDEAKRKWCHRSPGPPSKFERCIGSECMAWRTRKRSTPVGDTMVKRVEGFCGLAGVPK